MKTAGERYWFFVLLHCFLVGSLVESSSLSSSTLIKYVVTNVGKQVVLPCSWKPHLREVAPSACHIQWKTTTNSVFERQGEQRWQAEKFNGRVEVPGERLESGDCSLIISDVQIQDTGRYESYMVVDGVSSTKTRIFIQSVKLSVFDHKSLQSRGPGEDLALDLHTRHSVRVVFQGRNSSGWTGLWMRGGEDGQRLEKHPLKEQLTLKKLQSSDEGTYKVLDEHGLAVSTVQLSVEEHSTALKVQDIPEDRVPADDAAKSSCSALLILSVLLTTFQILHL